MPDRENDLSGRRGGRGRRKGGSPDTARDASKDSGASPTIDERTLLDTLERAGAPLARHELLHRLKLPRREWGRLEQDLDRLIRAGKVLKNRRDEYLLVERADLVVGRVIGHRDGFGFLRPDEGARDDDVFLPARQMRKVMHDDRAAVQVRRHDAQGRAMGSIVEVLERAHDTLVGRLCRESGITFVVPDNPRIPQHVLVPPRGTGGARVGEAVLVTLDEYPGEDRQAIGRVTRVLGARDEPGIDIELAIHAFDLPFEWPDDAMAQAEAFPDRVPRNAKAGRLDLRDVPLVTIDGADAKDFDDAVYCEPDGDGWRLMVAIADVSHYVRPGEALDREARRRGTSVYFPNRVIPMLPEALSNGLCSLKPNVDRLCMVCDMKVTPTGRVTASTFHQAVMRSAARLTYEQAESLLTGEPVARRVQRAKPQVEQLQAVYRALARARRRRGALDFDIPEVRFEFGEDGRVSGISGYSRGDSHRIIEECMIAANVEAARFLGKHRVPTLYRVHEGPADEKLEELRLFLATFGTRLPRGKTLHTRDLARVLRELRDHTQLELVEGVVLRSMQAAQYHPRNIGHFGLGLPAYAHFTSPIRRYPDLLVHRGIRHVLRKGGAKAFPYSHGDMEQLGEHCSMAERRADDATRDAVAWLKAEYMQDKVGETFLGVVSGVTGFGLFVEIKDVYIEGLVHVTSLDNDFYHFDPARHSLTGERGGRVFRIGDELKVQVARVSLDDRKIDLALAEEPGKPKPTDAPPKKRSRRSKRRKDADAAPVEAAAEPATPEPEAPAGDDEAPAPKKKRRRRGGRRRGAASGESNPASEPAGPDAGPEPGNEAGPPSEPHDDTPDAPEPGNEAVPPPRPEADKDGNTIAEPEAQPADKKPAGSGRRRSRRRRPSSS